MPERNLVRDIYVDDALFQKIFLEDALCFIAIDKNLDLSSPLKTKDIVQTNVGNCYFLSALASIIDTAPDKIKNIFQFYDNNTKVRVTLYNHEGQVSMRYHLQTTVVMQKKPSTLPFFSDKFSPYNNHTDPRVSLLEKAFALHRVMCLSDSVVYRQGFNPRSYQNSLTSGTEIEAYEALMNEQSLHMHLNCSSEDRSVLLYDRKLFKSILNTIVSGLIKICDADGGLIDDEHRCLRQSLINLDLLIINESDPIIGNNLLEMIKSRNLNEMASIGTEMLLHDIDLQSATEASRFKELKAVYSAIRDQGYLCPKLVKQLEIYNKAFQPSSKRGQIVYTDQQNQWFTIIHTALTHGQPSSLSTRNFSCRLLSMLTATKQSEYDYKGLIAHHSYQIMAAYSKKGANYLLLRNPHANGVRIYTKKSDGGLSASSATQIARSFWSVQSYAEQENSTLSREQFASCSELGGVFEVEFNDLCKHNCEVVISQTRTQQLEDRPIPAPILS